MNMNNTSGRKRSTTLCGARNDIGADDSSCVRGSANPFAIPISRRQALRQIACGFGSVAATALLAGEATPAPATVPGNPLAPRPPHFPARAKRVIFLFMHGGVSHVDTFDPKPKLKELDGRPLPFAKPRFEFAATGN